MVKRTSNKARIQKMAEEAAAGKKKNTEKKKTEKISTEKKKTVTKKKTTPRKKAAVAAKRLKVVWKVFDANFKEVACFPYPKKAKAYAKAKELIQKSGKSHFVNAVNVPMEEE